MKAAIQKSIDEETELRNKLKALIQSLPESADGITMLESSRCCSVPLSVIREHGFNWSPRYWLGAETKAALISLVDECDSLNSISRNIERIIKTGKVGCGKQYAVPPNIIEALKQAWED